MNTNNSSPRSIFAPLFSLPGSKDTTQSTTSANQPQPLQRRYSTSSLREAGAGAGNSKSQIEPPVTPTRPLHTRTLSHTILPSPQTKTSSPNFVVDVAAPSSVPASAPAAAPARLPSKKRSLASDQSSSRYSNGDYVQKKLRLAEPVRSRKVLDLSGFVGPSIDPTTPPSPLFFSNSPQPRPSLPPRFSSSEAGARMLSKTKEDSGVKTVKLARGTPNSGSPPSRFSPRSRSSTERFSIPRSTPDTSERPDQTIVLKEIGITEFLDQDDRPIFIVDLEDTVLYQHGPLPIVFANSTLRNSPGVLDYVSGRVQEQFAGPLSPRAHPQFKVWLLGGSAKGESLETSSRSFPHHGFIWSYSTLRRRMRVVSGRLISSSNDDSSVTTSHSATSVYGSTTSMPSADILPVSAQSLDMRNGLATEEQHDYFGSDAVQATAAISPPNDQSTQVITSVESADLLKASNDQLKDLSPIMTTPAVQNIFETDSPLPSSSLGPVKDTGFFDWTRLPNTDSLPEHIQFARSIDWAATSLGPIENWSPDLRQMCNLIMASPHPAAMYWGDDLIAIYNEAYVFIAGQKHPKLMGQSYSEAWAEIWDEVKDVFASARTTGQATMKDDDCLFITRNKFLEETYFSWSIIPLVGGDGTVMGLYNPAFEKTRRKIAERRMLTLREVGERTAVARDLRGFWKEVLTALEFNEYDTPFVLIYSVSEDNDSDSSSAHSNSIYGGRQCNLEGGLGVPEGHEAAPRQIDLKSGTEGFGPLFREVMWTNKSLVFNVTKGEISPGLLEGMEWRGFGDATTSVVVCPIHPTTSESTLGFLVLGINPRRPYDDDYGLFVQLLSRQLATSLASVVLFEEEIKRGQRAARLAALDRIELSEQLAARTQEAIESETKFTRMAEFAPVGMFIADSSGHVTYCNDTWYDITRVPKDSRSTDQWMEYIIEEDLPRVKKLWDELINKAEATTAEFRFKVPWRDPNGTLGDTWVLFSAYPEKWDEGTLKSVFGSITNISQQKWAEGFQKRKMEEAVELKRQQENFIDVTSHEMRNPLSAILQCADMLLNTLTDFKAAGSTQIDDKLLESNIEAAQTISLCGLHQKRIIDDVLTMSKLDSALVVVTPVDVQPLGIVHGALKMFEGELHTADIQTEFVIDESFKKLGIDWVRCDSFRVLQILINLTTNAIKFTTTEDKRTITVTLAASLQRPSEVQKPVVNYIPARSKQRDITRDADWGGGSDVYIQFLVEDTGRGLTDEEMKLLFLRFSQASPRTHVQYGGSGLGLFISRELTELQGGQIGVASEAGKGSCFAFFVKARRSLKPPKPSEQLPVPSSVTRKPSDAKTGGRNPQPPKARDFAPGARHQEPHEPLHVLLVEDNIVNQRVLAKQLQNNGCIVHVANHGGEALDRLRNSSFWVGHTINPVELNVVLMDQEMPVMDGLTCTKKIREYERSGMLRRHVPIIAVTANARSEQIQTALEAGMDFVVSKPFRIPDLMPKMEELVEKNRKKSPVLPGTPA